MPYITFAERYGMEIGIEKGIKKGIEKGIEQGIEREKDLIAKRMLLEGIEIAFIAKITELSPTYIQKLQQA